MNLTTSQELLEAITALNDTASDEGCDGDLTVVSKSALAKLLELKNQWPVVAIEIRFVPEDVVEHARDMGKKVNTGKASLWIANRKREIEDALCSHGAEVIRDHLSMSDEKDFR